MRSLSKRLTQTEEGLRDYQQERLILEATELICLLLEKEGVTRAELARRLGKSRSFVTQLLDGKNMTLRTLADVFTALGRSVHLTAGGITLDVRPRLSEDQSRGKLLRFPPVEWTAEGLSGQHWELAPGGGMQGVSPHPWAGRQVVQA